MAKQIITRLTDDLDGSEADETVHFSLDGVGYEIDLSAKNAAGFREFMARFMDAGTRTGRVAPGQFASLTRRVQTPVSTGLNREQNQKIRTWASANGWDMSQRGRIPQMIVDAFDSKTPNPEWLAKQAAAKKVEEEIKPSGPARTPRKAAGKPVPKAEFAKA